MRNSIIGFGFLCIFTCLLFAKEKPENSEKNWPQWRGPYANGLSPDANPPIEWSENKNVKWKTELPGMGHATPIIWGDQLFILTAVDIDGQLQTKNEQQQSSQRRPPPRSTKSKHQFLVLSINRQDGKIQWQKTVKEEVPEESTHDLGSWASNSPVTDGKHIYAYFGSRGIFCLDMQGNLKWQRDFGQMEKRRSFGEGSSPVLYDNKVILLWDHEGDSYIIALDKNTGKDIWKTDRDEGTSWSTPFVVENNGKAQIVTSATRLVRSYDPGTGDLIWKSSGLFANVIPSPLVKNDIVYVMSGHRGNALLAIRFSQAKGDISNSDAIVWKYDKETPYTPSPLLIDNMLYFLRRNNGSLSCLDARDGKVYYSKQKLEGAGNIYTSPVGTQNHFYILGRSGITYVIKHGPEFEILNQNKLEDNFHASPAIIENNMYLRGFKYLYCITQD